MLNSVVSSSGFHNFQDNSFSRQLLHQTNDFLFFQQHLISSTAPSNRWFPMFKNSFFINCWIKQAVCTYFISKAQLNCCTKHATLFILTFCTVGNINLLDLKHFAASILPTTITVMHIRKCHNPKPVVDGPGDISWSLVDQYVDISERVLPYIFITIFVVSLHLTSPNNYMIRSNEIWFAHDPLPKYNNSLTRQQ